MPNRRRRADALEPSAFAVAYAERSRLGRSSDPRRRIIDAFVETVALHGYERTTVDRVLHMAEVPVPVFDEHFEDMEDCMLQAIDELIGRVECMVLERISTASSWPERIEVGLHTLLCALAFDPDGARVAMVECLSSGTRAVERLHSALAMFVPILEEGREHAASVEHLPPQASEAVVGGIASILHRRVLEERTAELPSLLPDLLYFALMPYLGHHRALSAARLCTRT